MGYSTWSTDAWNTYSASTAKKATSTIFKSRTINDELNPFGVVMRESRDSDANPNSTAVVVGCDVTGSMGSIADHLVRRGIGVFFEELLARKPVSDPHMMIMGIGDAYCDKAPLQVSQFEADLKIAEWLEKIYIEGGGGGNSTESYELPYYFAYNHTSIDCLEKRGKKGYIFTIGDEEAPKKVQAGQVKSVIGDNITENIPFDIMLQKAQTMYHCFHIIIAEGHHASHYPTQVRDSWNQVMGQHAIWLDDYTKLSETIVSLIQMVEGEDRDSVVKSWTGSTAMTIDRATRGFKGLSVVNNSGKLLRF
jgi:hypothetical protein